MGIRRARFVAPPGYTRLAPKYQFVRWGRERGRRATFAGSSWRRWKLQMGSQTGSTIGPSVILGNDIAIQAIAENHFSECV